MIPTLAKRRRRRSLSHEKGVTDLVWKMAQRVLTFRPFGVFFPCRSRRLALSERNRTGPNRTRLWLFFYYQHPLWGEVGLLGEFVGKVVMFLGGRGFSCGGGHSLLGALGVYIPGWGFETINQTCRSGKSLQLFWWKRSQYVKRYYYAAILRVADWLSFTRNRVKDN